MPTMQDRSDPTLDEGYAPVYGIDPATGEHYLRANVYLRNGAEEWREYFDPQGETLCRIEVTSNGRLFISKGSLDAVQAANMGFMPPENRAQIESLLVA